MNRVVLVTGGSGAIGQAIVRRFCRDGNRVAFTFHTQEKAAMELQEETQAIPFRSDLTNSREVRQTIEEILTQFGCIDVLINNAGATQIMPFALIEEEDWNSMIASNLTSMFFVTREVVRNMVSRKSGVIINVGSLAGHRLLEVPVHYATAKAGVSGFTISLAKELSRYHIRVNSVVPGLLDDGVGKMAPEKQVGEYNRFCTMGRPGKVQEVAEVIAFIASDKASYINAQNIFVDGGI